MVFNIKPKSKLFTGCRVDNCLQIGFDVGKIRDPSAVCVVVAEREPSKAKDSRTEYTVRYLKRLDLGMPYPRQVEEVVHMCSQAAERYKEEYKSDLIALMVDVTGVGEPVLDLLRGRLEKDVGDVELYACRFVGGERLIEDVDRHKRRISIGKDYFVNRLQVLIESERIHIPKTLSTAENLVEELLDFDIDVDEATGKPTYGAIRPGTHDDMVVALGLAVLPDLYDGLNLEGLRFVTGGGSRIRFPDTAYRGDWFDEAARHHGW